MLGRASTLWLTEHDVFQRFEETVAEKEKPREGSLIESRL
jgi:hypothetical protein